MKVMTWEPLTDTIFRYKFGHFLFIVNITPDGTWLSCNTGTKDDVRELSDGETITGAVKKWVFELLDEYRDHFEDLEEYKIDP